MRITRNITIKKRKRKMNYNPQRNSMKLRQKDQRVAITWTNKLRKSILTLNKTEKI